jgi:ketosteroid isomerase-like protein
MAEHPNVAMLRTGYGAFSAGDLETVAGLYTPDTVWHQPGNNLVSGDHQGLDAVLAFFVKLAELTAGTFKVEVHDLLANDEHGVCLATVSGNRGGKELNLIQTHVFHIKDEKITEAWTLSFDQAKEDDFWS